MPVASKATKLFWSEHINKFSTSDISAKEYCQQNNIDDNKFYYHRKKSLKGPIKGFSKVILPSKPTPKASLPDPKWLAEFLISLGEYQQ